mmetsp:Transcript_650/g.1048  ORF Transcript_650/g.1048 Transcript_650/m.1048 type:complete len:276 (-) Transcript_650:30-857(-)
MTEEYKEEQFEEFQSLVTIYRRKLESITNAAPYQVTLLLQCAAKSDNSDEEESSDEEHEEDYEIDMDNYEGFTNTNVRLLENSVMALRIKIDLPQDYPSVVPNISLHAIKELTNKDMMDLRKELLEQAEDNVGDIQIFDLVTYLMDRLYEIRDERFMEEEEEEETINRFTTDRELLGDYSNPNLKLGTPVSRENFAEWKEKFDAAVQKRKEENNEIKKWPGKMTGLAFFQQKDAQWIEQVENLTETTNDDDDKKKNADSLEVDEDLFLSDDDDDE